MQRQPPRARRTPELQRLLPRRGAQSRASRLLQLAEDLLELYVEGQTPQAVRVGQPGEAFLFGRQQIRHGEHGLAQALLQDGLRPSDQGRSGNEAFIRLILRALSDSS